jgi:Tol biopolymer transport system component
MLTGSPVFCGEDVAETLGAVIHTQPPLARLPATTPRAVRVILERCLDKNPKTRLRDIGEARMALAEVSIAEDVVVTPTAVSRTRLPWIVAGLASLLALSSVVWSRFNVPGTVEPGTVVRFDLTAPATTTFPIPAAMMALSPNGRTVAFAAIDSRGRRTLWYRHMDEPHAVPLSGTDGAWDPFWSSDSRTIAYFTDTELSSVDVQSGRRQSIWLGSGLGGTWRRDGQIVFATATGLYRVPASGGDATLVLDSARAPGQSNWHSPKFLPDGERVLYVARTPGSPDFQAFITTVEQPAPRQLMSVQSKVEYVEPGWIFFVAGGRLLAQRFDDGSGSVTGEPVALAGDLIGLAANGRKAFSVSPAGVLAFREHSDDTSLEVRDRTGKRLAQVGRTGDLFPIALSSDDRRLLFRRNEDVFMSDLPTGSETRLTFDAPGVVAPVWSPDSKWIAFRRAGRLYKVLSDGGGPPEDIGEAAGQLTQWSPDGRSLLADRSGVRGMRLIRVAEPTQYEELAGLPSGATEGQISADGKFIAYAYAERGDFQVYVQALTAGGGRWQVSQNGGRQPRWRRDGREIFYVAADGSITAAEIRTVGGFEVIAVRPLFDIGGATGLPNNVGYFYDVSSNGQQFVFSTDFLQQIRTPISIVLNWQEALRRLVATN